MFEEGEVTPEMHTRMAAIATELDKAISGHKQSEILVAMANVAVEVAMAGSQHDAWVEDFVETVRSIYVQRCAEPKAPVS